MEEKFKILRLAGTISKIEAWVALILGLLASVGFLLASIFGGEVLRRVIPPEQVPGGLRLYGVAGGLMVFVVLVVASAVYFLLCYTVGEAIYVFLAIEENTRLTAHLIQMHHASQPPPAPAVFTTPPPPPPPPPPAPRL